MTLDELISRVGRKSYYKCVQESQGNSPNSLKPLRSSVSHDLGSLLVYELDLTSEERIGLFCQVYRDIPHYGLIMYVRDLWPSVSPAAKTAWWTFAADTMDSKSDRYAAPMDYLMAVDFFEDGETVEEAWRALTHDLSRTRLVERVLEASAAVPYGLKRSLYEQLIGIDRWHYYIFRSLIVSVFGVYGKIEKVDAVHVLGRLVLHADTEHLDLLRERLGLKAR